MMIGHFARDEVFVDGRGGEVLGGAVYYGSIVMQRLGLKVAVATRLRQEDFPRLQDLHDEGVQVYATPAPQTSGIANYYNSADMERRVCRPLGFAGPFAPADIPDLAARIYMISPIIAGEVGLPLLQSLAARGPVSLDVQGFVRVREGDELVFRPWPQMVEGLRHVTYLKVDRAEAELLTGETDLTIAARRLKGYLRDSPGAPCEVVLTQSSGVTVYADGETYTAPFTSRSLDGRTGRGDTCFSTYLAKRLATSAAEACRWAGAVTSLKQEQPGPWRGTPADVESYFAAGRG